VNVQTPVVLVLTVGNVLNIRTRTAATEGIKTRLVATMSARVAVAVGLMVVGIVVVLAEVALQLVHVVMQAVGEVFKMTNLSALVVVLVVLVECWDSKIVPLSYSHNTCVNGPKEFKLIVQHRGADAGASGATRGGDGARVTQQDGVVGARPLCDG